MIDYFRLGKQLFEINKSNGELIAWISKGIITYIVKNTDRRISSHTSSFRSLIKECDAQNVMALRNSIKNLSEMNLNNETDWNNIKSSIRNICATYFGLPQVNNEFLNWAEISNVQATQTHRTTSVNSFIYKDENSLREVEISFGSIHSVKGRTHLVTLVVETFSYEFCIKSILPFLCGTPPAKIGTRLKDKLKCHYVALSRARGIVCLAIPNGNITAEQKTTLQGKGWNIVTL